MLLGAFPFDPDEVDEADLTMAASDTLILYTDGVTESGRAQRLGEAGLLATVDDVAAESPERVVRHIQRVAAQRARGVRADDAAVLLLRRTP